MLAMLGLFLAGVGAGAAGWAWRARATAVPVAGPDRRPGAGPRGRRTATSQDALLAAFRPDELPDPTDALREDQRILADALRDLAKRYDATAALLWTLDPDVGGLAMPVASSADDARTSLTPAVLPIVGPTDRERVEWSVHNRQVLLDRLPGAPLMAVAPFESADTPGALTLHFDARADADVDRLRVLLPEHARAVQVLHDLVRTRAEVSRQNLRLRGLIRTAGTLQASRDPLELEQLLVTDSLMVAGAEWSVLVRWDEPTRTGEVRAATTEALRLGIEFAGLAVPPDCVVGEVCTEGRPAVYADARAYARGGDTLFGSRAPLAGLGSLLVVPLRRSEQERPIGALVCGHREVAALRALESRNLRNLAVIGAGALETAWAVEDARRNARTDPLTGLANRRGFDERFAQVVQETDRYGGAAALVLVDVDHFKRVNDTYGHEAGDLVLMSIANALADGRRTVDLVARLGGEEMVVLLPQTDAGGAREVAERLRKRIEALTVRTNLGEVRATASFGVAEYAARSGQAETVMERADQALYAAKRNGRNRIEVLA